MDYFSKLGHLRATVGPFVLVRLFESVGSFIGSFKRLCPFGPVELFQPVGSLVVYGFSMDF